MMMSMMISVYGCTDYRIQSLNNHRISFFFHSGKNDFLLSFLGGDSVTAAVAAAAVVQFHCEFDLKNISRHHRYG